MRKKVTMKVVKGESVLCPAVSISQLPWVGGDIVVAVDVDVVVVVASQAPWASFLRCSRTGFLK